MKMRSGSFCSGVAGLDLGAAEVFDAEPAWFCEKDEAAAAVLTARFPGVPNHGDLKTFDWSSAEPVDVLTMGFPCQPFSAAGRQQGAEDERHLFPMIIEAMEKMPVPPEWVVIENVPRLVTIQDGRVWAYVQDELMRLGYAGVWRIAPAASVGAPHLRKRVVLVARRSMTPVMRQSPVTYSSAGYPLLKTPTAQLAINGGSQHPDKRKSGGHGPTLADEVEHLLPTPTALAYGNNRGGAAGRVGPVRPSLHGIDEWGKYGPAIERWGALTRPAPAPREPGKNGLRLSARFVEWMVGLPDGWVTDIPGLSNAAVMRCLGNIVVPQFAATVIRELREEVEKGTDMTDLEPIRAANRARNAILVKKFTSADPSTYAPLVLDLADVLEEIARQWREKGAQLLAANRRGAKGTDEKLTYAASELAGIAVSLRNDGLPASDAEQVLAFLKGESDTLPPLPDVCGITEPISGATCAKGPHPIGTNHEGNGCIWPDRRTPEDPITTQTRVFARGPRPDDATDPGLASSWDDMQPPDHAFAGGHSGMTCVYLFELDGVGEECGRPAVHEVHGTIPPCQPIGCDNGIHLPGCAYASIDGDPCIVNRADLLHLAEAIAPGADTLPAADPFSDPAPRKGSSDFQQFKPEPKPRPLFPSVTDFGSAPDHVSISQIQTAESCGLQLRLQKRDGVAEQPWWANVAGTALHACLEDLERWRWSGAQPDGHLARVANGDADACREMFWTALDHAMADEVQASGFEPDQWRVAKKGVEGEAWWREQGPEMLRDYVAWSRSMVGAGWAILRLPSGPALELDFKLDLGFGLPLEGRIDQVWFRIVDGRMKILIVDPKSGAHIPDRFQLGGYGRGVADILRKGLGVEPGANYDLSAAYYNARTGALEPEFDPLEELSVEELTYRAGSTSGMHQANIYPANPNSAYGGPCGICGVRYACPIMALKS